MRLKHIKDADKIIMSSPYLVKNPCDYKGKWNKFFGYCIPLQFIQHGHHTICADHLAFRDLGVKHT